MAARKEFESKEMKSTVVVVPSETEWKEILRKGCNINKVIEAHRLLGDDSMVLVVGNSFIQGRVVGSFSLRSEPIYKETPELFLVELKADGSCRTAKVANLNGLTLSPHRDASVAIMGRDIISVIGYRNTRPVQEFYSVSKDGLKQLKSIPCGIDKHLRGIMALDDEMLLMVDNHSGLTLGRFDGVNFFKFPIVDEAYLYAPDCVQIVPSTRDIVYVTAKGFILNIFNLTTQTSTEIVKLGEKHGVGGYNVLLNGLALTQEDSVVVSIAKGGTVKKYDYRLPMPWLTCTSRNIQIRHSLENQFPPYVLNTIAGYDMPREVKQVRNSVRAMSVFHLPKPIISIYDKIRTLRKLVALGQPQENKRIHDFLSNLQNLLKRHGYKGYFQCVREAGLESLGIDLSKAISKAIPAKATILKAVDELVREIAKLDAETLGVSVVDLDRSYRLK